MKPIDFSTIEYAAIMFFGACLQTILILGLFMEPSRARLYKNALIVGFLANGIRSVGYLAPKLLHGFSPDMIGLYGNAAMLLLFLISYFRQKPADEAQEARRGQVVKYVFIAIGSALFLTIGVALVQSNRDVLTALGGVIPEVRETRAAARVVLLRDTKTITRLQVTVDSQYVALKDYRGQVAGLKKEVGKLNGRLSTMTDLLASLNRNIGTLTRKLEQPGAKPQPAPAIRGKGGKTSYRGEDEVTLPAHAYYVNLRDY